jgi:hypothetical protein
MRTVNVWIAALVLTAGAASAQSPAMIRLSQRVVTERDQFEATVSGSIDCGILVTGGEPRVDRVTRRIVLPLSNPRLCDPPSITPFQVTFSLGPLDSGTWTLEAVIDEQQPAAAFRTVDVEFSEQRLNLYGLLFSVAVEWSTPDGALKGEAFAVPTSDEGGYFWFFNATNPEVYVKIVDGTPVNGRWWIFISSTTNLEYKVHVGYLQLFEPPLVISKTYVSPAGANKNFIDTTFFAPAPTEF